MVQFGHCCTDEHWGGSSFNLYRWKRFIEFKSNLSTTEKNAYILMVFMFNSNKLNNTDSCVFMSSAKCQLFQGRGEIEQLLKQYGMQHHRKKGVISWNITLPFSQLYDSKSQFSPWNASCRNYSFIHM